MRSFESRERGIPKSLPWWGKLFKKPLKILGEIELYRYPSFILPKSTEYKVRGEEQRIILDKVRPGDILLRKQMKPLVSRFIPGYYTHAAVLVDDKHVIHAIGEGVIKCDILDFLRCDAVAVLRLHNTNEILVDKIQNRASQCLGREYDWVFDSKDSSRFSCTELVAFCIHDYPGITIKFRESGFAKDNVIPDDFFSLGLHVIHDSRVLNQK